ncbi:glycosyl hydrolase family 18 protein [Sinosporangium siamense]|uniref:chitinase n=1 Tax=Sinosporangium siamense TaxID=1367973 RepID=A0A919V610_9ACTN|nr:glycosyl hydrolase family 18 protein [Sinosporangium siamense]GII91471.1 chitinase [Sinosporangium siamense]
MRRKWPLLVLTTAASLLLTLLVPGAAFAAAPTATFTKQGDWGSGWQGSYTIRNNGTAPMTSWKVEFDLPAPIAVGSFWDASLTRAGQHFTFSNLSWNGTIAPGGSVSFGFLGQPGGTAAEPQNCKLNGAPCGGDITPPSAPSGLRSISQTSTSLQLAWNPSADDVAVKDYRVFRSGVLVATISAPTTTATVTGLNASTSYTFTVSARDTSDNESAQSSALTTRTEPPDIVVPSTPANLRVTGTSGSTISLAWNASTDNSGQIKDYRVYEGTTIVATVAGTSTITTITGLQPNSPHTYTVTARDDANNESAKSSPVTGTTGPPDPIPAVKVGYFVQWGIYGRGYTIKNLDTTGAAAKLTHVNYAFGNLHPTQHTCLQGVTRGTSPNPNDPNQGDGAGDAEADYQRVFGAETSVDGVGDTWNQPLAGNFNQIKKLKAKHPHLKFLISLGGWTYSKYFSDAASTPAKRQALVRSCLDIYIKGNLPVVNGRGGAGAAAGVFDGIDMDWEWPNAEGHPGNHISPADKNNLTLLLQEFRTQLDALGAANGKDYLLTAFTPADPVKIDAGWDISRIFDYLDFANIQGYDFHGSGSDNSWEPNRTGHQANLYLDPDSPYTTDFSVDKAVMHYLNAGVNPKKLTIGLAFYGRGWQQVAAGGRNGEWQTAGGAAPGDFPEEAGIRGYKNIATAVPGCTVQHDTVAIATYCYTGNGGQWWSFDDAWSIQKKTEYIKAKGLLGGMIWEMTGDTGVLMTALDNGLR